MGLCGAGLLGICERYAAQGPGMLDPALKGAVGRLGNIPSPPFSFFPCLLPKKDWMLDVDLSQCGSVHKKKRRGMEGGGLCEYSETTEINRAEKNSGKKSARLRVKGFYC